MTNGNGIFNFRLCEKRHNDIEDDMNNLISRLKSVENRFLAMITLLVTNLAGVIVILASLLLK